MSSNLEQQRQHTLQQQKALRQKEEFRRKQQEKAARDAQKQSGRNYAPLTFQTNPPTSQVTSPFRLLSFSMETTV